MRTILCVVTVMGLLGGAMGAAAAPKPAKAPKAAFPPAMAPLQISEIGTPLVCQRNTDCTIRGRLGDSIRLIALVGDDGVQRIALTKSWAKAEVKFRIPLTVPAGNYSLGIVDAKLQPVSNTIRVSATRTNGELAANCAKDPDADGDGHDRIECGGNDCDDADGGRYPSGIEVCDAANHDEDCDITTFGYRDSDLDGVPDARCCNGPYCGTDCDDARSTQNPIAPEVCNLYDDNCDGWIDEQVMLTAWQDTDNDLYGDASKSKKVCPHLVPKGWVTNDLDCDDKNVAKNPRGGCP